MRLLLLLNSPDVGFSLDTCPLRAFASVGQVTSARLVVIDVRGAKGHLQEMERLAVGISFPFAQLVLTRLGARTLDAPSADYWTGGGLVNSSNVNYAIMQ